MTEPAREIPGDVMERARATADAIIDGLLDRGPLAVIPTKERQDAAAIIARAIMAERARCARIVETWGEDDKCIQPMFPPLAAAIRGQG